MPDAVDLKDDGAGIRSDLGRFLSLAREGGIRAAAMHSVRVLAHRMIWKRFDRKLDLVLGPDSAAAIEARNLDFAGPNHSSANACEPTRGALLSVMLRDIPEDLSAFTFIDVGSGKGRVLCRASRYGFRRVLGIELSGRLHREARENVAAWLRSGDAACRDVESINTDAASFGFPPEDLIVYLYNPFGPEVLEKVAANLRRAWQDGRRLYVVYYHPVHRGVLDRCGFLKPVGRGRLSRFLHATLSPSGVAIYRAV